MAENSAISWTDHTWSPWYGCTQVSMGEKGACVGCYARHLSETRMGRVVFGGPGRGEGTRDARADSAWKDPIRWNKEAAAAERAWFAPGGPPDGGMNKPFPYPTFVFPSMCDPFDNHPALTELRRRFFDLIRATPHLTWLLLTKRPGNIQRLFADTVTPDYDLVARHPANYWPRNAAIGCTVVTQEEADRDIPKLLAAKAALKPAFAFVSMEPLMGPVDLDYLTSGKDMHFGPLSGMLQAATGSGSLEAKLAGHPARHLPTLDWVITGGETDQGSHRARPTHPGWHRHLRDQCAAAGVPFHFKQWGSWVTEDQSPEDIVLPGECTCFWGGPIDGNGWPTGDQTCAYHVKAKAAGRLLDGVEHNARPVVTPLARSAA